MERLTNVEELLLKDWVTSNSSIPVTEVLLYDVVCFARIWVAEGGYKEPGDIWEGFLSSPVGVTYFNSNP